MACSKTAVPNAIAKYQTDGSNSDQKKSGYPRKTTFRYDCIIKSSFTPFNEFMGKNSKCLLLGDTYNCFFEIGQWILAKILQICSKTKIDCENEKEAPGIHQKTWTLDKGKIRKHVLWWIQDAIVFFFMLQHHIKRPPRKGYKKIYYANYETPSQPDDHGTAGIYFLDPGNTIND